MRFNHLVVLIFSAVIIPLLIVSCSESVDSFEETTFYLSEEIGFGEDGSIQAYSEFNESDELIEFGIFLSRHIFEEELPGEHQEITIRFPRAEEAPPYNHFGINWAPHGHLPLEVYGEPHFDFHVYFISQIERGTITGENQEAMYLEPAPVYVAPDYELLEDSGVPQMGAHWVDKTSPEFNDGEFTHTYIYGYYNAQMIFIEPMITLDFLRSVDERVDIPIKLPEAFQRSGYYPSRYYIERDMLTDEVRIIFTDIEFHEAS